MHAYCEWTKKAAARVAGAMLLAAAGWAPALAAEDISNKLMIEKGREVFLTAGGVGCVSCHGSNAEGSMGLGPSTHGSDERAIRTALQTEKCMEFLRHELSDAMIKQLAAYFQSIGKLKLIKALAYRGRFVPDRLEVHPGTPVHLVIVNADTQAHIFTSDGLGFEKLTMDGQQDMGLVWQAPESEGTLSVVCADCGLEGQRLTFVVTAEAPKFAPQTGRPNTIAMRVPTAPQKVALTSSERDMVSRGRELFLHAGDVGCAGCHGRYAEGDLGIGSYNRGFSEASIRRALKTVGPMNFLADSLGETEIKQIAAYYKSLTDTQLIKAVVVRGLFVPEEVRIHPGTAVQLVITNTGHAPRTFITGAMGLGRITVPPKESVELAWTAPKYRHSVAVDCIDCPYNRQRLIIDVTDAVPPYAPPMALK